MQITNYTLAPAILIFITGKLPMNNELLNMASNQCNILV